MNRFRFRLRYLRVSCCWRLLDEPRSFDDRKEVFEKERAIMADLENLLLQAAGRTGSGQKNNNSRPQSRWKRDNSYSDGSDSRDDDSDDPKYTKRKPSGSQVPLKKRFDPPEKDKRGGWRDDDNDDGGGRHSDDDSDSAPSVGSDLYKDDADKEELGKMSELDREMILAERSTKIDDYKLKKMARASSSKMEKSRKERSPPLPIRGRSSAQNDRTAAKSALNELRAKRMRQQDPEGYRSRLRDLTGEGAIGGFALRDSSPSKRRILGIAASPPSDISNEGESGGRADSDDDRFHEDKKMDDDLLEDLSPSRLDAPKFEDVKNITIRRSKLVKWFMEPFFEELISGCFVRLGIGKTRSGKPKYKLCLVRNVDATDPGKHYKLEHYTTYKWLNCIWGSDSSAARWQMAMVSDSPPLEDEFNEWKWQVENDGGRMPTHQEILDKKEEIQKINNFVYSAATVKQMLLEKKSASLRPVNIAAEKDRLRKEMEVAQSRRDEAEVERIRARLKELEDISRKTKQVDEKAVRLAEMNRRNRAENFKNASELKPVNTSLKAGEAGYDPFSRRWTRSMNYYVSKPGGDGNAVAANDDHEKPVVAGVANGVVTIIGVEAGEAATAAALQAAAGAGKLVDTSAPVDHGTASNFLHNFELPISLAALQNFGGPQGVHLGLMARKQKIEAAIGYKVPDNDGRRHPLTLTVSDYKRRRGLL
ncbi:Plus-3 domain containing protein [Musa troglodytarum]|uniref:Plus-3 domain containing protein n=1 Tax=Musa troglodytarum TaxID=320322 RepID=A0A9E7E908_9LILI|nr:Plus-3 domain containing protein [Musa troglodytarum]